MINHKYDHPLYHSKNELTKFILTGKPWHMDNTEWGPSLSTPLYMPEWRAAEMMAPTLVGMVTMYYIVAHSFKGHCVLLDSLPAAIHSLPLISFQEGYSLVVKAF